MSQELKTTALNMLIIIGFRVMRLPIERLARRQLRPSSRKLLCSIRRITIGIRIKFSTMIAVENAIIGGSSKARISTGYPINPDILQDTPIPPWSLARGLSRLRTHSKNIIAMNAKTKEHIVYIAKMSQRNACEKSSSLNLVTNKHGKEILITKVLSVG